MTKHDGPVCVCVGGGGRGGLGLVGGFGADGFFEVYLIHSEFTTHSGLNGRAISSANC